MNRQSTVDDVLRAFLAGGAERAPEAAVLDVLEQIEATTQRRAPLIVGHDGRRSPTFKIAALIAVAVLMVAIGIGIGIQVGLIRLPSPQPQPSAPAERSLNLLTIAPADSGISFGYPEGWELTNERAFELWQYEGTSPAERMSVSFGTGFNVTVCTVECTDLVFDMPVPYDAERAAAIIAANVSQATSVTDWQPLDESALPGLEGGLIQETTAPDEQAGERRDVVVVGVFMGRAVAFTWSQPIDEFDRDLMEEALAAVFLDPAGPGYARGDLMSHNDRVGGYELSLPDHWYEAEQPLIGEQAASGVRRFGQPELSELTISSGDPDGSLRLCDAACVAISGVTSLAELESAVSDWLPPSTGTEERGDTTVGGVDARFIRRDVEGASGARTWYAAYLLREGRPYVLAFDVTSEAVTIEGIEEVVASFTFLAVPTGGGETFAAADESFALDLTEGWRVSEGPDPSALYLSRASRAGGGVVELSVRWGDQAGQIRNCDEPAGPWEVCRIAAATSLEELEAAVAIEPVADHGVGPPTPTVDSVVLDGEPAKLIEILAYEYPAQSGQVVAYLIAEHDDRPLVIRLWTNDNELPDIDEVLAGFRFQD